MQSFNFVVKAPRIKSTVYPCRVGAPQKVVARKTVDSPCCHDWQAPTRPLKFHSVAVRYLECLVRHASYQRDHFIIKTLLYNCNYISHVFYMRTLKEILRKSINWLVIKDFFLRDDLKRKQNRSYLICRNLNI